MLQSMQNIDILSSKDNLGTINKIQDKIGNNALLATLRIAGDDKSDHTRVELKMRTNEG
jgi:hypothetical protein